MTKEIRVGISDYKVSQAPDKLITLGLGSCVGIAIYDEKTKIGGLSHIMLPDSTAFTRDIKPEKFADLAIPKMIDEITGGKSASKLIAKIAGGASMFNFSDSSSGNSIGDRNVVAVEKKLKELGIPIISSDTGGNIGRTMIVDLQNFNISIRTANREIKIL
ncbi:chemotaxis protein CheD [Wansuia hejianensis]|uniref:Probable chemoreceptor glutamine deamidase CheD n=1 Tax=Wansuia hejianensis TaxID=2763667 RepID=A0A926IH70_9FIRM|nr:chemotaxis protein CheD [Wansuia hejianensis]MBC8590337.1 chemotaxis protein CheD [Wansuia hejianensis]